jgi:hypothetical protein
LHASSESIAGTASAKAYYALQTQPFALVELSRFRPNLIKVRSAEANENVRKVWPAPLSPGQT